MASSTGKWEAVVLWGGTGGRGHCRGIFQGMVGPGAVSRGEKPSLEPALRRPVPLQPSCSLRIGARAAWPAKGIACGSASTPGWSQLCPEPWLCRSPAGSGFQPWGRLSWVDVRSGRREHSCFSPAVLCLITALPPGHGHQASQEDAVQEPQGDATGMSLDRMSS